MNPSDDLQPVRDAIARGNLIEAIKLYREIRGEGLRESKEAIDRLAAGLPAGPEPVRVTGPLRDEDLARLRELLQLGSKIEAIKLHRERTGAGLKESKDAVEALEIQWREGMTQIPGQRAGGCLGLLILAFVR